MNEKIINMYSAGYSQKEICEKLKVSFYIVNRCLKDNGFSTHAYRSLPCETIQNICFMVKEGYEQKYICEVLDVSIYVVRDIVRRFSLQNMAKNKKLKQLEDKVVKLFKEGDSIHEIMMKLHISNHTVKTILKNKNIDLDSRNNKDDQILTLFDKGYSYAAITKELVTSYRRINRVVSDRKEQCHNEQYGTIQ